MAWTVTVGEWATVAEVVVWVVVRAAKVVVEAALVLGFDVGEREFACFYVPGDWLQMMWVEVANVTWNAMGDQMEAQAMVAGDVAWVVIRAVGGGGSGVEIEVDGSGGVIGGVDGVAEEDVAEAAVDVVVLGVRFQSSASESSSSMGGWRGRGATA